MSNVDSPASRFAPWCLAALTALSSGCASDAQRKPDVLAGTGEPSAPRAPATAASDPVASASSPGPSGAPPTVPWRFLGADPPRQLPGPVVEARTLVTQDQSLPAVCRFEDNDKETRLGCMTGSDLFWWHAWRSVGQTAALLPLATDLVVVMHSPVSSGAELRVYDIRGGEERLRLRLQGLGAVSHSEYWNRVELQAFPDGVIAVYGNEAAGKYVELVDIGAGRTLSVRKADEPAARVPDQPLPLLNTPTTSEPWVDVKQEPLVAGGSRDLDRTITLQGISCKLYVTKSPDTVPFGGNLGFRCQDAKKGLLVAHESVRARLGAENAVLVDAAGVPLLVMVRYHAMASGAALFAYDLQAASLRYVVPLTGLGPISHSKYHNDVRLAVRGANVIVYGKESQGRYVEVRDLASGNLLGNRKLE